MFNVWSLFLLLWIVAATEFWEYPDTDRCTDNWRDDSTYPRICDDAEEVEKPTTDETTDYTEEKINEKTFAFVTSKLAGNITSEHTDDDRC